MKREMATQSVISWIFIGLCAVPFAMAAKIDENTVALWLFDEGSGDVLKDFSGNRNNGKVFEAEWISLAMRLSLMASRVKLTTLQRQADHCWCHGRILTEEGILP